MYFQLYRHLPCLVSLVWLIFFFLIYIWFLTIIWIAILICLEHSYWITQPGSDPSNGFTKAWTFYLKTKCALVNQEVDDYLRSKDSKDWFTTKYCPSEAECAECRKIVFNNLLRKSSLCFCYAQTIANMPLARPKASTWSLWDLLEWVME